MLSGWSEHSSQWENLKTFFNFVYIWFFFFYLCPGRALSCLWMKSWIMFTDNGLGIISIGFQLCLLCTENSLFPSVFLLIYQRWWFLNYLFGSAYTLSIIASQSPSALLKPCLGTNLSNWSLVNGQCFGSKHYCHLKICFLSKADNVFHDPPKPACPPPSSWRTGHNSFPDKTNDLSLTMETELACHWRPGDNISDLCFWPALCLAGAVLVPSCL